MKKRIHWQNHFFNFLAVILGVYLAFYISERSKTSQEDKEMATLKTSLINDLDEDIRTYENYQIPFNRRQEGQIDSLIFLLDTGDGEAISAALPTLFQLENYAPTTSTYVSMKSAGKLALIKDHNLRRLLAEYYDGYGVESERKGQFQVDYFSNTILPWLTENVDLMEMRVLDNDGLISFGNKLIIYSSMVNQKTESYVTALEKSKDLKAELSKFE